MSVALTASLRSRLFSGGIWSLFGKIGSAVTSLLISGLLARLLSPDNVGVYFLVFSLVMAGSVVAQLGLNQVAVRLIAETIAKTKTDQIRSLIYRIILFASISTLTLALLMSTSIGTWVASSVFKSATMAQVTGIASLWLIMHSIQSVLAECFRGLHNIKLATLFQTLAANLILLTLLTSIWFISQQTTVYAVIVYTIISGAVSILFAVLLLYTHVRNYPVSTTIEYSNKQIFQTAWPFLVTNITIFILSQTGLWVLGIYRAPDEVALYGAAARLITLVAMPLMIANAVLPPVITELHTQEKYQKLQRVLRSTATVTSIPALVVIAWFIFFGEFTLTLVFGEFYAQATHILLILALGQIINIWAGSCGLTLMMTGNQTTMMLITLFASLLSIVLSVAVVTPYGVTGIAVITAGTLIIQNLLMLIYAKRKAGVWTHASLSIEPFREILKG